MGEVGAELSANQGGRSEAASSVRSSPWEHSLSRAVHLSPHPPQRSHPERSPVLEASGGGCSGLSERPGREHVLLSLGVFAITGRPARGRGGAVHPMDTLFHGILTTTLRSS